VPRDAPDGTRQELAELEAELREIEEADREQAVEQAFVLKGKKAALFERYSRMNTSQHHRAEKALKDGLRRPLEPAPGEWTAGDTAGPSVPPDQEPGPESQEIEVEEVTAGPAVPLPAPGAAGTGHRLVVNGEPVPNERAVLRAEADTTAAQASAVQQDTTTILANKNAPKEIGSGPAGRAQTSGHWQVDRVTRPPGRPPDAVSRPWARPGAGPRKPLPGHSPPSG
jgi:hypothetical protein